MSQIALLTNFTFVPCKPRSLLGEIWKLPIRRGQREGFERQAISDGLVAGWISKGTSLWGLSWAPRDGWISTPPAVIFEVYRESLLGFSCGHHPDGLNSTLLCQGCVLEDTSHCGKRGYGVQSTPFKDRGGVKSFQLQVTPSPYQFDKAVKYLKCVMDTW